MNILYMLCDCYVWPIEIATRRGRCGRCRTRPMGAYETKREAVIQFTAQHGHAPKEIG